MQRFSCSCTDVHTQGLPAFIRIFNCRNQVLEDLPVRPIPGARDNRIETVSVLKKDGKYRLWYTGYEHPVPDSLIRVF